VTQLGGIGDPTNCTCAHDWKLRCRKGLLFQYIGLVPRESSSPHSGQHHNLQTRKLCVGYQLIHEHCVKSEELYRTVLILHVFTFIKYLLQLEE